MIVINVLCDYDQILIPSVVAERNRLLVLRLFFSSSAPREDRSVMLLQCSRSSDVSRVQYNIFTGSTMTE